MSSVRRYRYRLQAISLIPILLMASGCGGDDGADTSSDPGKSTSAGSSESADGASGSYDPGDGTTPAQFPCDEVTADEIGALLGGTYTFKLGPLDPCDFDPEDPIAFPTAYIAIDSFLTDFPTLKGANPGATDVDVALDGFVADDPASDVLKNGFALVTDDGVTLRVTLAGGEQTDRDEQIEGLLTLAASKL